jgi:hypothetical protein
MAWVVLYTNDCSILILMPRIKNAFFLVSGWNFLIRLSVCEIVTVVPFFLGLSMFQNVAIPHRVVHIKKMVQFLISLFLFRLDANPHRKPLFQSVILWFHTSLRYVYRYHSSLSCPYFNLSFTHNNGMNQHSSGHSVPVHRFSSLLSFLFLAMHLYPDAYVFLLENVNEAKFPWMIGLCYFMVWLGLIPEINSFRI